MVAEPVDVSLLEKLFGDIGIFLNRLFIRIADSIESAFNELANGIANLFQKVINSLETIVSKIANVVGDIFGRIEEFIQITINEVLIFIDETLSDIVLGISRLIGDTTQFIQTMVTDVVEFFEVLIRDSSRFLSDLFDNVWGAISTIVDQVATFFSDIFDVVVISIENFVDQVKVFLTELFDSVKEGVLTILGQGQRVVDGLKSGIQDFINEVLGEIGGSLVNLLDTISNLPGEIAELANKLIESARENIGDPIRSIPIKLIEDIAETITGNSIDELDRMQLESLNLVLGTSPVPRSEELFREGIARSMPSNPILKGIVTAILSPLIIIQSLSGIASANSQIILQEHALENPYRLIEPPDIIRSEHFDLLSKTDALTEFKRHGFTESASQILLGIGETIPPEAEQVVWWLRGISTQEEFDQALTSHGWSKASIDKLKLSAFFIPPVQDLITMAVREVFTPEIAERFGQFEDLPPEFVANAAKQGVSENWANNYWAAHWALPSVQMGFEMLHRRVITLEDMDLLLRSADVMPFWRDKIVAISFNPLTRVDIRRMHKLDVLTETEVFDAYQDIGYNPENAQRLLDFTIALNRPSQAQDDQDLSILTRTNIINFFTDGILSRGDAEQLLIDIGLSRDAAALFIDAAEIDLQRSERKAEISIILDRVSSGVLTFEEGQDQLNRLGLESLEIQLALVDLAKREAKNNKLPSRADLDKMLGKDLITEDVYLTTMGKLGYSSFWSSRYLGLTRG